MSDFENFLCFSSATAQRCGTGTAEAKERRLRRRNTRREREKRQGKILKNPNWQKWTVKVSWLSDRFSSLFVNGQIEYESQ